MASFLLELNSVNIKEESYRCQCPLGLVLPPPGTLIMPAYPLKKPFVTDPSGFHYHPINGTWYAPLIHNKVNNIVNSIKDYVSMPFRAGTPATGDTN